MSAMPGGGGWWSRSVSALPRGLAAAAAAAAASAHLPRPEQVNPIVGSRTGATGGTFNYALGNLRLSSIDVPRHKVIVVCEQDRVTIKASDISASLTGFTWL